MGIKTVNNELGSNEKLASEMPASNEKTDDYKISEISDKNEKTAPETKQSHKLNNYLTFTEQYDTLHQKAIQPINCKRELCVGALMSGQAGARPVQSTDIPRPRDEVIKHAKDFLEQYYAAQNKLTSDSYNKRLSEVLSSIEKTGTYDLTYDELSYGAKLAWRNAPRCIGRMHWNKILVFDCRDVKTTDQMFKAICRHLKEATNGGNIRSAITVFPKREVGKPDFRVWNPQLLSYAGYEQDDGTVIGDPARVKLTQICQKLGWKGKGGRFDTLPLVLNASGEDPKFYELPEDIVLEVEIRHPEYDWFEDMGLRWYSVPAVSDMLFDIGGIEFPATPFNGWYMSSEIGSRDFCDRQRYNIVEEVAVKMGLDVTSTINLWKDQALVEVNRAVIYSYQSKNVTIVDHHSASDSFIKHMESEQKVRGGCPADWVWIVPPISGGLTQVFHQEMLNYTLKPSYEYQEKAWKTHVWINKEMEKRQKESGRKMKLSSIAKAIFFASYLMNKYMKQRTKATILYATETGKSEAYAHRIGAIFRRAFNSEICCMDSYHPANLEKESLILVVTSTFGSGDAPDNGKTFASRLEEITQASDINNNNVPSKIMGNRMQNSYNAYGSNQSKSMKPRFAVFALGSTAYPDFCVFGKTCDNSLASLGYHRLLHVATADELKGEEQSFKKWAQEVFQSACKEFRIPVDSSMDVASNLADEEAWSPDMYRLTRAGEQLQDLYEGLSKLHHKNVLPCRMISRVQLQSPQSSRQTILARFDTKGAEELQYSPGDHVGIFPTNRQELVSGIAKRLKNVPSLTDVLVLQTVNQENVRSGRVKAWKDAGRLPPCSIITALSHFLDITTPPSQQFLKMLAKSASEPSHIVELQNLANNDDMYDSWKEDRFPTLLETIEQFDSVRLDVGMLFKMVPVMQPRFYSISSSPVFCHGEIHATVGVVTFKTQGGNGPTHYGVCTNFLNSFPSSDIPCFIRKAPSFHIPEDRTRPVIMVGPGTGIAPFRGFWQQRKYEMPKTSSQKKASNKKWLNFRLVFDCNAGLRHDMRFGKMTLFFGCRHPALDDIYRPELAALASSLPGFQSHVAYSRIEDKPKTYVQDLIKAEGATIYRQMTKEQGHFYVCGEAAMAAEVRNTLKKVLEIHGNMNEEEAEKFFAGLKTEGRFHEDIFGVLIRGK